MSRLPDQNKLSRLQLAGMLSLVVTVVALLASYFFYQQWQDYQRSRDALHTQSRQLQQTFLRTWGEDALLTLDTLNRQTHTLLRQRIREQVDQAHALATALYRDHHDSGEPPARARREIVEALRPLRYFGGRGYFFIDTLQGDCVLLPTQAALEGRSLLDNRDDSGTYIMRSLIAATAGPDGAGFASYRWYRPGEGRMAEKVAYARRFEPFGWLIGGGEYVDNVSRDLQQQGLALLAQMRNGVHGGFIVLDAQGRLRQDFGRPPRQALPPALQQRLLRTAAGQIIDFRLGPAGQDTAYRAYVGRMAAWGWRVIAVMPASQLQGDAGKLQQDLGTRTQERVLATLGIFLAALLLAVLFSLSFTRWLRQLASAYQQQIGERQRALEHKARELELTRHMSDSAADIIVLCDSQGRIAYSNQRARECFEHSGDGTLQILFAGREDGSSRELSLPCCGGQLMLEVRLSTVDYHGERYRCATARDIGQRLEQERALLLAAKVFESSTEAIVITDPDSHIVAVNQAFSRITGYQAEEVLGHTPALLSSGRHDGQFFQQLWAQLRERGQWAGEIWNRRKSGEIYPEWLSINALRDSEGKLSNYIAMFSDISERKEAEARVRHLAEYDYLTDLPNRLLLMDRLQQALRVAERSGHKVAVLFMDLDRFKNINDTLGHTTGDTLLQEVARRMRHVVRDMDTVGRTGGDEFVMILPELADSAQAALIGERVLGALRQPFMLDGHQLVISASIGIAISPDDGKDATLLLKNADMAMYEAKAQGRNNYRFFTERMTAEVRQRLLLENRLRGALARQELYLVLQPKYRVADRSLSGFEALLRWQDQQGQHIPPAQFIPVAEDSGLIVDIGSWVLRQACQLAAAWPLATATPALTMAVNVSPRQLAQPGFAAMVAGVLQDCGLAAAQLEIEVTESALLERTGHVKDALDGLKQLGVRLAVDDFGTGYSSLAYLKDFAPDTVKIDRCFVTDLQHRDDNAAIVLAIITLARSLKMEALAEGVETEEELAALAALGCEAVQGYLTGRPLPLAAAASLVADWQQQAGALIEAQGVA